MPRERACTCISSLLANHREYATQTVLEYRLKNTKLDSCKCLLTTKGVEGVAQNLKTGKRSDSKSDNAMMAPMNTKYLQVK